MKILSNLLFATIFFVVFCLGCKSIKDESSDADREKYYKDYFLAKCITLAFGKDSVFLQDISFTVYNELTDYVTLTSHGDKLDSLAQNFVDSIKPYQLEDYEGKRPIFLQTIRYYNSKELSSEIKKIVKSPRTKSKK